jgi:hypothetical protein
MRYYLVNYEGDILLETVHDSYVLEELGQAVAGERNGRCYEVSRSASTVLI